LTSSHGEAEARPGVVQALFSALTDMDPSALAKIEATGITRAERDEAENLFAASLGASRSQRERSLEAMRILTRSGKLRRERTWAELFDDLTPEGTAALRGLYDALPDGARAEWDLRHGRPADL
jgi:hypothetical protein